MSNNGKKIQVLLVDDHQIIRDGLRALITAQSDMDVVNEADNGREAVRMAQEDPCDVAVMDIGMPDMNGMEATRKIATEAPHVRVIALSMHSDKRFITAMFRAGASGYMLKDCAFDELVQAIRTVTVGRTYLSPEVTDIVVEDYINQVPPADLEASSILTNREREVLQLLSEGLPNRLIAPRLQVSIKTVETYRRKIMEKLNLHSIAELTKYAVREGLTTLDE